MAKSYNRKDHFYQKAKQEGFRSRAAYKLLELEEKYQILSPCSKVLDLGCFPGGWLQVASSVCRDNASIVGIDIVDVATFTSQEVSQTKMKSMPSVLKGDIRDEKSKELILEQLGGKADIILSDMSPKLTGVVFGDIARIAELIDVALDLCSSLLKKNGNMIVKSFPGKETDDLFLKIKSLFKSVKRVNIDTTRKSSNEYYIVMKNLK